MKILKKFFCAVLIVFLLAGVCNFCGCYNMKGEFLWLDEAYEHGWITLENLEEISNIYNDLYKEPKSEDFSNKVKKLPLLDEDIMKNIAKAYQKVYYNKYKQQPSLTDIHVTKSYFGMYQKCYVISVSSKGDPLFREEYCIDGIIFYNYNVLGVYKINDKGE